jgi:hypothetical protein
MIWDQENESTHWQWPKFERGRVRRWSTPVRGHVLGDALVASQNGGIEFIPDGNDHHF